MKNYRNEDTVLKDALDFFEYFWRVYPKKENEPDAFKAYKNSLKKVSPATIIGALWEQKEKMKGLSYIFPEANVWLDKEFWKDSNFFEMWEGKTCD